MKQVPAIDGRRGEAMFDRDMGGFYVFSVAVLLTWEIGTIF